jgi:hypothetical protein
MTAKTDLVPCFYTGQNFRWERPVAFRVRAELHQLKKEKLGRFDQHGAIFLFFQKVVEHVVERWEGTPSAQNLLHFVRTHCEGDKLHYETPMAGDNDLLHRFGMYFDGSRYVTRTIPVSSRSLFNVQILP